MNGRMYDPVVGRMLSPDNFVQAPFSTQSFNRYAYVFNNPLNFVDPDGQIAWYIPIIAGTVIGGYMGGAAANNDFNPGRWDWNSGDTWKGIGSGMVVGAISGAGWSFGLASLNGSAFVGGNTIISGISLSGFSQTAAVIVLAGKGINTLTTGASLIANFNNATRIVAGRYYLDENVSFGEQLLQGISRNTWEGLQNWGGYNFTQLRNTFGGVDRVDYLGGATFSTGENSGRRMGVSLGNFLNVWIRDEIGADFQNRVVNDPLFMHEYGHITDSRIFGFGYLFFIGIPSASGAEYTELRANRFAARYFARHYGVDWTLYEENRPTRRA